MKFAIIALTLLFLTNIPSLYYGLYKIYPWFDTIQHFLGGFFVAMLMVAYLKDHLLSGKHIKNILIVVGATLFIGVAWEFAEYIANQTLIDPFYRWFRIRAYFMGDLRDTMADLLMDTLGAITLLSFLKFKNLFAKQSDPAPNLSADRH